MRITRRQLASAALAATPLAAQVPARTPEEELALARKQIRENAQILRKLTVPIATEPSFAFRP